MFPTAGSTTRRLRAAGGAAVVAGLVATVMLFRPATPDVAAAEPAPGPAADLALVPADATGFVHVRLADLWKNDLFAGLRKTWERAGEKAVTAFDKQFVPAPSSLDRVTAFVVMDEDTKQPQVFGVIAFSAPFVPAQIAKLYLPDAKKKTVAGKAVYVDEGKGFAVTFPDNRHVLIGMPDPLEAYLAKPVAKAGPMAGALKLAASGRPVVAAVNVAALPIPPGALDDVPEDVRPILRAEQLLVSVDLGAEARLDVRATYKDAAASGDAEKAVRALVAIGRKELAKQAKQLEDKLYDPDIKTPRPPDQFADAFGAVFGLGALGRVDDLLSDPKLIARDGKNLTFSAAMPKEIATAVGGFAALGIGLAMPAVGKVREAAGNSKSQNNLKQIGVACHGYHAGYDKWPADITDADGKPILSWRVAILPFIEQSALHKQFKLDEPWDSENNKKASQTVIQTYLSPNDKTVPPAGGYGMTNYLGVSGPGTVFDPKARKLKITDITDGTSNTVAVVETSDPVPWAKPGDLPFDAKKELPKIVSPGMTDAFNAMMCDGSVRKVDGNKTSATTIKAAFTRSGGEVLGADW